MTNSSAPGGSPPVAGARWIGWGFALALVVYACALHHGLGPPPRGAPRHWYEPAGFLVRVAPFAFESATRLFACSTLPALLLAAAVFATGRSAIARALALTCVAAIPLFVFYGELAPQPWRFFGWRWSAVIWLVAACVGFAAAAPMLAASWLTLGWGSRLAVYLPVAFGVVAVIRNCTGTDAELKLAISPWPAVPVFGIEVAALFIAAALTGIAVAAAGGAAADAHPTRWRVAIRIAALAAGLLIPLGLVALGAGLGLLPFRLRAQTLVGVASVCAVAVAAVSIRTRSAGPGQLARRARALALGAILVAAPLLAGQLLARIDYEVTRERRARAIIDALNRHAERESLYPDALEDLVSAGDLAAVPAPAIGFAFLSDAAFRYQSFGSSFILEFEAPRWVECAYTPPYANDDDAEDEAPLGESWSCPSQPPELW